MANTVRQDIESEMLAPFQEVLDQLGISPTGFRGEKENRFDPGFGLTGNRRYQYGDLRVNQDDRIVIVEVESGGGLTNLLKYWPHIEHFASPVLLLHVFGTGTPGNYASHIRLWEFTWQRIRSLIWSENPPRLFARKYQYTTTDTTNWSKAVDDFRRCLTEPLPDVCRDIFGYRDHLPNGSALRD